MNEDLAKRDKARKRTTAKLKQLYALEYGSEYLENMRVEVKVRLSLREKAKNIFKRYSSWTTIGVIANSLPRGLKSVIKGVINGF